MSFFKLLVPALATPAPVGATIWVGYEIMNEDGKTKSNIDTIKSKNLSLNNEFE